MLNILGLGFDISNIWIYLFIAAGIIALIRAGAGPSFADRYLGVGAFINIVALLVVVHAIGIGSQFYLDIAMLLVMLSFVGSLGIAKYAPRRQAMTKTKAEDNKNGKGAKA